MAGTQPSDRYGQAASGPAVPFADDQPHPTAPVRGGVGRPPLGTGGRAPLLDRFAARDHPPTDRPRVQLPVCRRRDDPRPGDPRAGSGALAIPPAWTDVWICPDPAGHLQATGRDARGRKQYRYHARWRAGRDDAKFERLIDFARVLPRIRERCDADLARPGLTREKVLAAVVRLLELTLIRVGNDEYARLNRSFGLTTLENRHAPVDGHLDPLPVPRQVRPAARGRASRPAAGGGRPALPGPARPGAVPVRRRGRASRTTSGRRTSTTTCARSPARTSRPRTSGPGPARSSPTARSGRWRPGEDERAARHNVVEAVRLTAGRLGNTPAVARRSYVHPAILEAYLDGKIGGALLEAAEEQRQPPSAPDPDEEREVVSLLRARLRASRSQASR